jgi:hypothetical protein
VFKSRISGDSYTSDILRYTVSIDKVDKVSSLSSATYGRLALLGKDAKTIFHFGGIADGKAVHKFETLTDTIVRLPKELPVPVMYISGASINGTVSIFDGRSRQIIEFIEESGSSGIIGHLPFQTDASVVASTTAIPDGKDGVWLFAGNDAKPTNPILQYNTTTKDVNISLPNTTSLPTLYYVPASVYNGRQGYLIGGLGRVTEGDGSSHPSNGILR